MENKTKNYDTNTFEKTSSAVKKNLSFLNNLEMLEEATKGYCNYYDSEGKKLFLGNLIEIRGEFDAGSKIFSEKYSLSEEGKGEPYFFVGFDKGSEFKECVLYDKPQFYLESNKNPVPLKKGEELNFPNSRIKKCLENLSRNPLVPSDKRFINGNSKN